MRNPDELFESSEQVVHRGLTYSGGGLSPLFSGGHDSLCAVYIASHSRWFTGDVHHIDTGVGADYTRRFVESVCDQYGWKLRVWKSNATWEKFVSTLGFPGPGMHQWCYNWLKDRCIGKIAKGYPHLLTTGCRSAESRRRMGHVDPVKVGLIAKSGKNKGKLTKRNQVWCAPCHDWTKSEQAVFMDEFGLPINKFKVSVGLSGECGCLAFGNLQEAEAWREFAPEVAQKNDELAKVAKANGKPCIWGGGRPKGKRIVVPPTGPLCSGCDRRANANGIVVSE